MGVKVICGACRGTGFTTCTRCGPLLIRPVCPACVDEFDADCAWCDDGYLDVELAKKCLSCTSDKRVKCTHCEGRGVSFDQLELFNDSGKDG